MREERAFCESCGAPAVERVGRLDAARVAIACAACGWRGVVVDALGEVVETGRRKRWERLR